MKHVFNWPTEDSKCQTRCFPPTSSIPEPLNVAITLRPGARDRAKVVTVVLQCPLFFYFIRQVSLAVHIAEKIYSVRRYYSHEMRESLSR